VRRAPRGVPEGTKGVARGAERAQPADRRENAPVRLLQARPRRARAFRTICKATAAEQPPARRHRALGAAATPRRRRSAPFNACTTRSSASSERSGRENGTWACFDSIESIAQHPHTCCRGACGITRSPSSTYARIVHTNRTVDNTRKKPATPLDTTPPCQPAATSRTRRAQCPAAKRARLASFLAFLEATRLRRSSSAAAS
jgi:hypothetical protein